LADSNARRDAAFEKWQDMCSRKARRGFTLIELLVVIAIIAILAAILFPVFAKARERAKSTTCLSNLKQIALSMRTYADDYDGGYPSGNGEIWPLSGPGVPANNQYPAPNRGTMNTSLVPMCQFFGKPGQRNILLAQVKSEEVFVCPSTVKSGSGWKFSTTTALNPTSYWYCNYEVVPASDAKVNAADAVNPGFDITTMPAGAKIQWLGANGGPKKASASEWPLAEDAYIEQAHFKNKQPKGGSAAMINRAYYDGHVGALKYFSPY
jgi:prepilin-type N-terminal cleavage/methylation domain-containing protein